MDSAVTNIHEREKERERKGDDKWGMSVSQRHWFGWKKNWRLYVWALDIGHDVEPNNSCHNIRRGIISFCVVESDLLHLISEFLICFACGTRMLPESFAVKKSQQQPEFLLSIKFWSHSNRFTWLVNARAQTQHGKSKHMLVPSVQ